MVTTRFISKSIGNINPMKGNNIELSGGVSSTKIPANVKIARIPVSKIDI
ncbi:hypothetical protein KGMB02408_13790 [Bacteroides faecalis]|uniref:Uncharacterized protein n=1 Tax=Bacteroides faecalis TaxID=2447885 RepID=A0A401LSF1_9BACE|nr:hypothetical protein KGMB02408_13790 [Bacteroides faecalis]